MKLAGSWTALLFRSANPSALVSSRPRVERLLEIATRWPWDLAYPLTGPCTVSLNATVVSGGPPPGAVSEPAANGLMSVQLPLNMYFVSLPQSVSTYWSTMSVLEEGALQEKSAPRPRPTSGPDPGNPAPRASIPPPCRSISFSTCG